MGLIPICVSDEQRLEVGQQLQEVGEEPKVSGYGRSTHASEEAARQHEGSVEAFDELAFGSTFVERHEGSRTLHEVDEGSQRVPLADDEVFKEHWLNEYTPAMADLSDASPSNLWARMA